MALNDEIVSGRGSVKLVAHQSSWAECFSEEKQLLVETLGSKVLDIRHIGSTSILGMPAGSTTVATLPSALLYGRSLFFPERAPQPLFDTDFSPL